MREIKMPHLSLVKSASTPSAVTAELIDLLKTYDRLIAVLRETYDEGLDNYTDNLVGMVVNCREALAGELDNNAGHALVKDMRAGLHEFPRVLRSLLPGLGPRLGESIEHKLGIQFAQYE